MPLKYKIASAIGALILVVAFGCNYTPTAPFAGFDEMGSRVSGQFESEGGASGLRAFPQTTFDGMRVFVKQDTSIQTSVKSNGSFTLEGIPDGRVTLVFETDVRVMGEIRIENVRPNQEIRIVLRITVDLRVILVDDDRDQVEFSVSCARSPSFWCRASNGNSSSLTLEEFRELAEDAASMLSGIPELENADGVADAVCRKNSDRDRFLRELAALALNIAAGLDRDAPVMDGEFNTIGEAFDAAVEIAKGNPSPGQLDKFDDLLDDINENKNTTIPGCDDEDSDDDSKTDNKSEDSKSSSSSSSSSGG